MVENILQILALRPYVELRNPDAEGRTSKNCSRRRAARAMTSRSASCASSPYTPQQSSASSRPASCGQAWSSLLTPQVRPRRSRPWTAVPLSRGGTLGQWRDRQSSGFKPTMDLAPWASSWSDTTRKCS
jgi:hypothetical protein